MNVICILWKGDFRGRDFTEDDVERLYDTVKKHTIRPFNFYTLTNDMDAKVTGEKIELKHNWPGWWAKMELHRSDLPAGRTLYLDLDTHVVGRLDPLMDHYGNLVMFRARSTGSSNWHGKKQVHRYQAATMLFTPGSTVWLYDMFKKNPQGYIDTYRSDQDLMGDCLPNQPTFPDQWLMKLSKLKKQPLGDHTIIVTGQPKSTSFRDPDFMPWLNTISR
jgi:hypothetical protein